MCSALLPLDRRVQHMCKRHFLLLIKLGRAIFGICGVQQHLTAAAAVSLHHRYPTRVTQDVFPPPLKTRAESTQTSRAMVKKKKIILFHVGLIGSSVPSPSPSPPCGYLWCVSWGLELAASSHLHTITQIRRHQLLVIITIVMKANLITERRLAFFFVF